MIFSGWLEQSRWGNIRQCASTYNRKALDAILGVQFGRARGMLLGHPAMKVLFTDVLLAVVCHYHAQEAPLLDALGHGR